MSIVSWIQLVTSIFRQALMCGEAADVCSTPAVYLLMPSPTTPRSWTHRGVHPQPHCTVTRSTDTWSHTYVLWHIHSDGFSSHHHGHATSGMDTSQHMPRAYTASATVTPPKPCRERLADWHQQQLAQTLHHTTKWLTHTHRVTGRGTPQSD